MEHMDSERRPGLGSTFLSVYGITRGMCETGQSRTVPAAPQRWLARVANALRKRVRPPRP